MSPETTRFSGSHTENQTPTEKRREELLTKLKDLQQKRDAAQRSLSEKQELLAKGKVQAAIKDETEREYIDSVKDAQGNVVTGKMRQESGEYFSRPSSLRNIMDTFRRRTQLTDSEYERHVSEAVTSRIAKKVEEETEAIKKLTEEIAQVQSSLGETRQEYREKVLTNADYLKKLRESGEKLAQDSGFKRQDVIAQTLKDEEDRNYKAQRERDRIQESRKSYLSPEQIDAINANEQPVEPFTVVLPAELVQAVPPFVMESTQDTYVNGLAEYNRKDSYRPLHEREGVLTSYRLSVEFSREMLGEEPVIPGIEKKVVQRLQKEAFEKGKKINEIHHGSETARFIKFMRDQGKFGEETYFDSALFVVEATLADYEAEQSEKLSDQQKKALKDALIDSVTAGMAFNPYSKPVLDYNTLLHIYVDSQQTEHPFEYKNFGKTVQDVVKRGTGYFDTYDVIQKNVKKAEAVKKKLRDIPAVARVLNTRNNSVLPTNNVFAPPESDRIVANAEDIDTMPHPYTVWIRHDEEWLRTETRKLEIMEQGSPTLSGDRRFTEIEMLRREIQRVQNRKNEYERLLAELKQ